MGFFNRNREITVEPASTLGQADTLPASGGFGDRLAAGSNAAIDKATQIYNKNPKLIGGLAAVAGAILLTRMKRGRPSA